MHLWQGKKNPCLRRVLLRWGLVNRLMRGLGWQSGSELNLKKVGSIDIWNDQNFLKDIVRIEDRIQLKQQSGPFFSFLQIMYLYNP
jgi:hypothetical protein